MTLLVLGAVPWSGAGAEAPPCAVVVEFPGIGRGCNEGPYMRLLLPDGQSVLTHGPDPLPAGAEMGSEAVPQMRDMPWLPGLLVPPACTPALDPAAYRGVLVYARAFDAPDRYATIAPQVKDMATIANTLLFRETLARYKLLCDGTELVVKHAVLPTRAAAANPGTIFGDLSNAGYRLQSEKYWVWYDGGGCWCAGIGTIDADSRPLPINVNNRGPDWGITFGITGFFGWFVMMHENGHNLGAVQLDSPQTSGGFHCNDGWDVMCYPDGGSNSHYNGNVCPPMAPDALPHWDCHSDDYAALVPGSEYIASHWNVASPMNRFVTVAG